MHSRPEKSLLAERRRLEKRRDDLAVQLELVDQSIDRVDNAINSLRVEPEPTT